MPGERPVFRPHPSKEDLAAHQDGRWFNPLNFLRNSVEEGPFHFALLVPHVVLPVYGIYRLLFQKGYWPYELTQAGSFLMPFVQGASAGAFVGCLAMRFSETGRRSAVRRAEGAAKTEEEKKLYRIDMGFAVTFYVFVAVTLWQWLPTADTPHITTFRQLLQRVGIDDSKWLS